MTASAPRSSCFLTALRALAVFAVATLAPLPSARGSPPAPGAGATIMFVVVNSAALDAQETAKKALMQGWGYTVTPISDSASQAAFDAAAQSSSVAYISETVTSTNVGTKLTGATIGVVDEEGSLSDEIGFASAVSTFTGNTINITSTTHYITSTLTAGTQTLFSSGQPVRYLSGTLGGYTTLGQQVATTNTTLAVFERGATLSSGGTAAGRRVYLPFGNTGYDVNTLTATGKTIMQRAIEWCLRPLAWYTLDDAAGSIANDSAGGYDGTVSGATWTTGKLTGGLQFNGSTNYVSIANAAAFQVTTALTVTGWVRATGAWGVDDDMDPVLRKGDSAPLNWMLGISSGRVELSLDQWDNAGLYGGTTMATSRWYHVAGTWDGATARVYVNGVLDGSAAKVAPIGTDTRPVFLGGRTGSTDVFQGVMDEVRFYNRCLTPGEIAAMANVSPTLTSWENVAP
jgi:hypothetical protein